MRVVHTIMYTTFFWALVGIYSLFNGVSVTVPAAQAEVANYQTAQAQDVFNAVDHPKRGR